MPVRRDGTHALAPEDEPPAARSLADLTDPAAWLSLVNPTGGEANWATASASVAAGRSSEPEVAALVERWVRRLSLGTDPRRAAARLEIGAGRYAGAELLVVAEGGHVSVEVSLPEAANEPDLAERLRRRLEGRGYGAEVTVR
jgi:hypothetical protein